MNYHSHGDISEDLKTLQSWIFDLGSGINNRASIAPGQAIGEIDRSLPLYQAVYKKVSDDLRELDSKARDVKMMTVPSMLKEVSQTFRKMTGPIRDIKKRLKWAIDKLREERARIIGMDSKGGL